MLNADSLTCEDCHLDWTKCNVLDSLNIPNPGPRPIATQEALYVYFRNYMVNVSNLQSMSFDLVPAEMLTLSLVCRKVVD